MVDTSKLNEDEQKLASLGYKQELSRTWSGFSNFAISFSIISILAGCFTTFSSGWNNGGPIAIAIGWPLISTFILIIGFCMSELVSAYPTSGGIYWWASQARQRQSRLLHRLAQPRRTRRHRGLGRLRLRDLPRLQPARFSASWAEGYSLTAGLPAVRRHPRHRLAGQHLLQSPAGHRQQRLGVVARHRARGHRRHPLVLPRRRATHWNVNDVFTDAGQ